MLLRSGTYITEIRSCGVFARTIPIEPLMISIVKPPGRSPIKTAARKDSHIINTSRRAAAVRSGSGTKNPEAPPRTC